MLKITLICRFQQDNLTLMKLMNICEYLMLTMTELFLLCYLGQTMKVQVSCQFPN